MNYWIFVPFLFLTVLMSGCINRTERTVGPPAAPALEQKQGETTKTGTVIEDNGVYLLQELGQPPLAIDSYTVELSQYVGQTVTVTGQYSGDTLFVGEIK